MARPLDRLLLAADKHVSKHSLKMPWERGAMRAVFSQSDLSSLSQCSVPAPLQTEPLDSASFEEAAAKAHPQEHASQFVQVAFSARKFQKPQETEEQQLQLLATRYDILLSHAYECSSLGRLLKDKCETDRVSLVAEALGGKALSTLKKRLSSLARLVGWCSNQGMSAFPIDSQVLIEYTQHLQQSGASHSVFGSCIEACNFARFILGVDATGEPHKHPLVQGRLRKVRFNRPPRVQARAVKAMFIDFAEGEGFLECISTSHKCLWAKAWVEVWRLSGHPVATGSCSLPLLQSPMLNGSWSGRRIPTGRFVTWISSILKSGDESMGFDLKGHSCKHTALSWASKTDMSKDSCTILGHHSLKDRRSVVTYSRDIQAGPLRELCQMYCDIRCGRYLPDMTRSGLYAKGPASADSAEELPCDSVFETEAERNWYRPAVSPGSACDSEALSCANAFASEPGLSDQRDASDDDTPFGRAVDSLIHSAERAAWEDPDAAFEDDRSQGEEPDSSSSSESSSDSGSSDSEIDEVLTASQADPPVGQRYHDRCPVYQQKNTRTLHLKPAGSSMERFICGRDITAAFEERAKECGLTQAELDVLVRKGLTSLSLLAFSVSTPGEVPQEAELRSILDPTDPTTVPLRALSALRRLMFEAQTLSIAQLKSSIEGEGEKKAELAPAERTNRITDQRKRLVGLSLTGPLENAFSNYTYVAQVVDQDCLSYLEPHRFLTRAMEVNREKPGKELILDEGSRMSIRDKAHKDKCGIQNELQLSEALCRRALACDLLQLCTFASMDLWHRHLLAKLSEQPPPYYAKVSMEQLLRCDKAAWVRMSELLTSLKKDDAGNLPMDAALDKLQYDPKIMMHLAPLPGAKWKGDGKGDKGTKRDADGKPKLPPHRPGKGAGKVKCPEALSDSRLKHNCVFRHGGIVGLTNTCRSFPQSVHCDVNNDDADNLVLGVTDFSGVPLDSLMFLDVFCGSGGLCAALRQLGMKLSVGLDRHAQRGCKCPVVSLDLTKPGSRAILLDLLRQPHVVACHLSPPVTTSCVGLAGPRPSGLRNAAHPEGLPGLQGADLDLVNGANALFAMCAEVWHFCWSHGVFCSIAHPSRSIMWLTASLRSCQASPFLSTSLHQCMFGSYRRKATRLLHTVPFLQKLGVTCDGAHAHEPWRSPACNRAKDAGLPPMLCKSFAQALVDQLLACGARGPACSLANASLSLSLGARVTTAAQPSGRKIPPLVPEFSRTVKVSGPADQLPCTSKTKLLSAWTVPKTVFCTPFLSSLPAGSKCLRASPYAPRGMAPTSEPATFASTSEPTAGAEPCSSAAGAEPCSSEGVVLSSPDPLVPRCQPAPALPLPVTSAAGATPNVKSGLELLFGIPWSPSEFVEQACNAKHPRSLDQGVPIGMSACIDHLCEHSSVSVARERTAELRKWMLRKKELDESFDGPEHCKKILAGKPLKLFGEMVKAAGHADANLVRDIQNGFDLLGEIPSSSVLPKKTTVASLSIEDVRIATPANQRAIWEATRTCRDPEIASEVYRLTLEERDKGWLTGPFSLADVPETAIVTRRFGVRQGVTTTANGVAAKIRPIDDFTESLANLTCTCAETIDPHSVNVIVVLLHIHWSVFFDDFVAVSSPEEKGHLDLVLRSYFALIGWETSDEKARKRELVSTIESIVQQGGVHAKELECLRGRLQFAESQVFGRGAAQRMRAISKAMKLSGFVVLDDSLTEALLFLKDRVLHGEARMIRACDRSTYHLFTDASYEADAPAGLGGILYSDRGLLLRWYSESADPDVLEAINKEGKQGLIYELEACAAVQGVVQLCNSLSDCNLICYCDNEAALAALIKCASDSPVVASQLNKLSMLEDEKGISIWFERVESSANPADDPSRFVFGKLPTNFRVRWAPGEELLF
ncbi:unnamed protein product [Symbiodinium sp. CCMP2592]|nr:unnamed protein product [Symbiodinium sp. CCMP2592]